MARVNVAARNYNRTHEGAPAVPSLSAEKQLRRSLMACLLWEDQFYEDGKSIADRIRAAAELVHPSVLSNLAIEAREVHNLRHAPLLLLEVLTRTGAGSALVSDTISRVIQRADEIGEFLAIYWGGGDHRTCQPGRGKTLSAQARKGLQKAFAKFDAYQFAKYDRDGVIKLRDALRLTHPNPIVREDFGTPAAVPHRNELYKAIRDRTLTAPDTWEVALSGGADKKETFERLLKDKKLGYLALLRNLRNMDQAGVDSQLVEAAIVARKGGAERVLPFRYVAAARAAPRYEPSLDAALQKAIAELPKLRGETVVLVDVSGLMDMKLAGKSDMSRMDAAAALASVLHCEQLRVFTFSNHIQEVPPRRGMAGVDAVLNSQSHQGTYLGRAVQFINKEVGYDRLIVVSDEQSADVVPDPLPGTRAYMINVASYQNGVGYGPWTHLDGFSEGVIRYITESESER